MKKIRCVLVIYFMFSRINGEVKDMEMCDWQSRSGSPGKARAGGGLPASVV